MSNTMLVLWMLRQPTATLISLYHRLSLAQLDGEDTKPAFDPNHWCSPESSRETVRARGDSMSSTRSSASSVVEAEVSVEVSVFSLYNGSSLSPALSQRYAAILAPYVLIHQVGQGVWVFGCLGAWVFSVLWLYCQRLHAANGGGCSLRG